MRYGIHAVLPTRLATRALLLAFLVPAFPSFAFGAPPALPAGTITAADLAGSFTGIAKRGGSVRDLFVLLADGKDRVVPGDAVRELFGSFGVELEFLPLEALREIRTTGKVLEFHFDFDGSRTRSIEVPKRRGVVLLHKDRKDPLAARSPNAAKVVDRGGWKVRLRNVVRFTIGETGITDIRNGDLELKTPFGWFDLDVRTMHSPEGIARKDGHPLLVMDEEGHPVVRDGQFVPQRYDDWIEFEVARRKVQLGIPAMKKAVTAKALEAKRTGERS